MKKSKLQEFLQATKSEKPNLELNDNIKDIEYYIDQIIENLYTGDLDLTKTKEIYASLAYITNHIDKPMDELKNKIRVQEKESKRKTYAFVAACALVAILLMNVSIVALYLIIMYGPDFVSKKIKSFNEDTDILRSELTTLTNYKKTLEWYKIVYNRKLVKLAEFHEGEAKLYSPEEKDEMANVIEPANQLIINYLDGYEINLSEVPIQIQMVAKKMLQNDLGAECDDLMILLNTAKAKMELKTEMHCRKRWLG